MARLEGLGKFKRLDDPFGTRTRGLPASSIAPHSPTQPRAIIIIIIIITIIIIINIILWGQLGSLADSDHGVFFLFFFYIMGHAVALWLRHYATSRKAVGSKPDEVNECFQFI
jgi:hypothetical protein